MRIRTRYIIANYGPPVLNDQYERVLSEFLKADHFDDIGDGDINPELFDKDINGLINEIGEYHFKQCKNDMDNDKKSPFEIFIHLAKLNLPLFLTTSASTLLEKAIAMYSEKQPKSHNHPWRRSMASEKKPHKDRDYLAELFDNSSKKVTETGKTTVYHLFGQNKPWLHRMLSEEDFFKFLRSISPKSPSNMPLNLASDLVTHNLLLLGFSIHDWEFRILLQLLTTLKKQNEGKDLHNARLQISVQIDPDDELIMDTYKAKDYLKKSLDLSDITIFWGGEDEFICQLSKRIETQRSNSVVEDAGENHEK